MHTSMMRSLLIEWQVSSWISSEEGDSSKLKAQSSKLKAQSSKLLPLLPSLRATGVRRFNRKGVI
jgi:hypothetical protein